MSTPQTVEDVFKDIDQELHGIIENFNDMDLYIAWITTR